MRREVFKWFVGMVLLNADATVKSRSIGLRENNPEVFWIKKEAEDIFEEAFGKELFSPEHSRDKIVLDADIDYFGMISKAVFMDQMINVYLQQTYKKDQLPEINQAIEKYVRNNLSYCMKLFAAAYINKLKELTKDIAKGILNLSGINRIIRSGHKKNSILISDHYRNKKFGLILGVNLESQYNYLSPIFESFGKKGIATLYLRGRNRDWLEKKDWGYVWNVRSPWMFKVLAKLKNRTYSTYKDDRKKLVDRIVNSNVDQVYKQNILENLDKEMQQYYLYKYFLEGILNDLKPAFVFVQPERAPLQRTLLMLIRKRNIPSITYNHLLKMGSGVIQWSYLADRVLVSNKNFADLLQEKGFSKDRIQIVGSTLVDSPPEQDSSEGGLKDEIDVLLLTKPAYKTISNDPVIENVINVLEERKANYRIFIRRHPFDKDLYKRFTDKYHNRIFLVERSIPLHGCVSNKEMIIICGISDALMECLPSGKSIMIVDISKNAAKSYLNRKDIREIVPLFENLEDFKIHMKKALDDIVMKKYEPYEIPQSLIDDFYYKLDGRASDRICEFVLSRSA